MESRHRITRDSKKTIRKGDPIDDDRTNTIPTPPPRALRHERQKSPPYHNDEPKPPRTYRHGRRKSPPYRNDGPHPQWKQETLDIRQIWLYKAPRHDDALTQMGVQIVTAELRKGCALPAEVDEETLQRHVQDRTTLAERRSENRQPQSELHEVGNRPMILRIATFNYLETWTAQPIFK